MSNLQLTNSCVGHHLTMLWCDERVFFRRHDGAFFLTGKNEQKRASDLTKKCVQHVLLDIFTTIV